MKLTEALIEHYIDDAKIIISRCYPSFVPPTIIKVTISRARSYWAQIKHIEDECYELTVSKIFEEIHDEEKFNQRLISCMIHELIHTQDGCWNHRSRFKQIGMLIHDTYPEYDISTATSSVDFGIMDKSEPTRYIITCSSCGAESKYKRKPKLWQYVGKKSSPYLCCVCQNSTFKGRTV